MLGDCLHTANLMKYTSVQRIYFKDTKDSRNQVSHCQKRKLPI